MKKIFVFLITAVLLLQMTVNVVLADTPVQDSKLTVVYGANDVCFDGLDVSIYRVADIGADNSYTLCGDFAYYPVNVKVVRTQEEWRTIATTLTAYIVADGISATATATTDENGEVSFDGLTKGLYLVSGVQCEKNDMVYVFESFFSSLPRPDENGVAQYDVKAVPKYTSYVPEPDEIEYKVTKQWKDDSSDKRPVSVEVEIYDDGELVYTEILSSDNNWCFTWKGVDDGSKWTVVERNINEGYTVTVTNEGASFVITNAYTSVTPPPQTGDVAVVWPYVLALFSAGAILMFLSVSIKRVKND